MKRVIPYLALGISLFSSPDARSLETKVVDDSVPVKELEYKDGAPFTTVLSGIASPGNKLFVQSGGGQTETNFDFSNPDSYKTMNDVYHNWDISDSGVNTFTDNLLWALKSRTVDNQYALFEVQPSSAMNIRDRFEFRPTESGLNVVQVDRFGKESVLQSYDTPLLQGGNLSVGRVESRAIDGVERERVVPLSTLEEKSEGPITHVYDFDFDTGELLPRYDFEGIRGFGLDSVGDELYIGGGSHDKHQFFGLGRIYRVDSNGFLTRFTDDIMAPVDDLVIDGDNLFTAESFYYDKVGGVSRYNLGDDFQLGQSRLDLKLQNNDLILSFDTKKGVDYRVESSSDPSFYEASEVGTYVGDGNKVTLSVASGLVPKSQTSSNTVNVPKPMNFYRLLESR